MTYPWGYKTISLVALAKFVKGSQMMLFNQYYLDCLSHASYLIGDETTKRAVVIDPQGRTGKYQVIVGGDPS